MPTFSTWTHENLVKFAEEAYVKLTIQQEQLEFTKLDLKDSLEAYRSVMRNRAPQP